MPFVPDTAPEAASAPRGRFVPDAPPPAAPEPLPARVPGIDYRHPWCRPGGRRPRAGASGLRQRQEAAARSPIRDKVVGAVEGALDIVAKVVGGGVGGIGGLWYGVLTGEGKTTHLKRWLRARSAVLASCATFTGRRTSPRAASRRPSSVAR